MKTLKFISTYKLVVKKSRFIGFAYPINNEEDAKNRIKELQSKYFDARHIVYAYKIGDSIIKKENSSEPAETAGTPILCAIENCELTNVLVVVVRYFGGVLLGASNLYKAYMDTAVNTINQNEIITLSKYIIYKVKLSYVDYAVVNSLANKLDDVKVLDGDFGVEIIINIGIKEKTNNQFLLDLIKGKDSIGELWL